MAVKQKNLAWGGANNLVATEDHLSGLCSGEGQREKQAKQLAANNSICTWTEELHLLPTSDSGS